MINISVDTLKKILLSRYAKYNSQHSSNRHYILSYKNENENENENDHFSVNNKTFENNVKTGESNANFIVYSDTDNNAYMYIRYQNVFESPHPTSPFHPSNSFYPKLFDGYHIGPFYATGTFDVDSNYMIPLMYNIDDGRVKILNFYKNNI